MAIKIPVGADKIIQTLEGAGYEAYVVGGCVRDSLLGRVPGDWDITTSAKPEQVKALFRRTVDTGIAHGTVTIMIGDTGYEVTTYRIDGKYSDHRRPDEVQFTASLEEDLKRRDFTINAMAYSHSWGVIDMFGGACDLANGVIRAVGEAKDRFDEDALRILRAVRFAGQLGFAIERNTREAMIQKAEYLQQISAERIRAELTKLLMSDHPEKLIDAYVMGITRYILPEFDRMMEQPQNTPYHIYNVGVHSVEAVKHIENTEMLRWAALLHDVGKPVVHTVDEKGIDHFYDHPEAGAPIAEEVLRRLKFDNHTVRDVCRLVRWHDFGLTGLPKKSRLRQLLGDVGVDFFPYILEIKKADMAAQSDYKLEQKKEKLAALTAMYEEIKADEDCVTVKDLAIGGRELIAMGMKPGRAIGEVLDRLLADVLENPELNNRDELIRRAREYMG